MRKIIALGLAMAGMTAITAITAAPKQRLEGWDGLSPFDLADGYGISKPKPNKVSQSKRRKYARQGRSK